MATKTNTILLIGAGTLMIGAFLLIFIYAPVDANMGIVQKIFYFHLSSAILMYLSWIICTVASVAYLVRRRATWDMLAVSAGELALVFAAMLMITGPLWSRKSWGTYWTWDPRLTSAMMLTLVIVSYVVLRSLAKSDVERRFGAALTILGTCLIPITHLSVVKWRGQHPTVITGKGGGLDPQMWGVFIASLIALGACYAVLLKLRYGFEKNRYRARMLAETLTIQDSEQGIDP
ncbi:MAG: cytochrome c biogenesis protein CcsA [Myxococcota bacterium]|nr:cytochrome c biogenesis protein CcsA [Myxococcota bacterium]